jgi:hypothetical protein
MSGALEAGTEHAVDGGKNPPEEDEKALAEEGDKKGGDDIGIYINPEGKEVTEQVDSFFPLIASPCSSSSVLFFDVDEVAVDFLQPAYNPYTHQTAHHSSN